jgi:phage-related protein
MGVCDAGVAAVEATAYDLSYEVAISHPVPYIIGAMDSGRYSIEIEPEVRLWLENIPAQHYKQAERVADLLAEQPTTLDEPHSRHLGGKLRELRFRLGDAHQRITYWLAPDRRVVLLTVFRKTKMREQAEVDRAHAAQRLCEAEHQAAAEHDLYSRDLKENR